MEKNKDDQSFKRLNLFKDIRAQIAYKRCIVLDKQFDDEEELPPAFADNLDMVTKKRKENNPIIALLKDVEVIIENHQDARIIYDNGYYGELKNDKTLALNYDEALHLLERGMVVILDDKGVKLGVDDCTKIFIQKVEDFWENYLVYKDLRTRGYIVGKGINNVVKYRLYPRGAKIGQDIAKTMICPLPEGRTINIETLDEIVTQSLSLKKRLLIACVDRLGDVSYYELQALFK